MSNLLIWPVSCGVPAFGGLKFSMAQKIVGGKASWRTCQLEEVQVWGQMPVGRQKFRQLALPAK